MKHQNMTFSIPIDLKAVLLTHVGNRSMSRFVSIAIRKAIEEEKQAKEKILDAAYKAANQDPERIETIKDWAALNDVQDLADNEDWSWLKNLREEK